MGPAGTFSSYWRQRFEPLSGMVLDHGHCDLGGLACGCYLDKGNPVR